MIKRLFDYFRKQPMSEQSEALDRTVGAEALVHIIFRRQGVRFRVRCRIGEWRRSYNRIEFNVAPIAGEGSAWVRQEHVEIAPEVVHMCPEADSGVTSCCGRSVFELPHNHRLTHDAMLVTCPEVIKCHANQNGDCFWEGCPQVRDGEPDKTGRHCPIV